ncbi:MAG: hypothetical protein D6728_16010 [Cyanobacteria bacterium J055]|nr:MAG: hypothetical protein D6728_16010 [Cyanobacteria bacterium J055]
MLEIFAFCENSGDGGNVRFSCRMDSIVEDDIVLGVTLVTIQNHFDPRGDRSDLGRDRFSKDR